MDATKLSRDEFFDLPEWYGDCPWDAVGDDAPRFVDNHGDEWVYLCQGVGAEHFRIRVDDLS